jgi:hypothetical protein
LALLGTLAFSATWETSPVAAQFGDSPGDVPSSVPIPPPDTPSAGDPAPAPADQPSDQAKPANGDQGSEHAQPVFEPEPEAAAPTGPWGVPPVKLTIPALGVEAAVEAVGQDEDGAMSAPTDPDEVAWYQLGPGMGVPGNVVFAGHVNWNGRLRAFGRIDHLDPGDVIQVIDAEGRGFEYAVESSHWVRAEGAPIEEIFAQPPEPMITLITCGGEFIPSRREYLDRLIVRAKGA